MNSQIYISSDICDMIAVPDAWTCHKTGRCFWKTTGQGNFTEGQAACQATTGGSLAIIETDELYRFIKDNIKWVSLYCPMMVEAWNIHTSVNWNKSTSQHHTQSNSPPSPHTHSHTFYHINLSFFDFNNNLFCSINRILMFFFLMLVSLKTLLSDWDSTIMMAGTNGRPTAHWRITSGRLRTWKSGAW